MAEVNVFILGASGYIGAAVLDLVYAKHPEYHYTVLIRSTATRKELLDRYPLLQPVIGDLENAELIETESKNANVVVNAADSTNLTAANAIIKGLAKRSTPGFYIHTSGTGILADVSDARAGTYTTTKIYDDIDDVDEIKSLPQTHFHQDVDQAIHHAPSNVKTAMITPPTIYGTGANARPKILQIPWLVDCIFKRGEAFQVNQGLNSWDAIHIRDLANIYLLLVESAADGGGKASWGKDGYYFAESQNYKWGDVSKAIAEIAQKKGYLKSSTVQQLSIEEVANIHPFGPLLWGSNSRSRATRVRRQFGWTPEYPNLWSALDGYVVEDARRNGLTQ